MKHLLSDCLSAIRRRMKTTISPKEEPAADPAPSSRLPDDDLGVRLRNVAHRMADYHLLVARIEASKKRNAAASQRDAAAAESISTANAHGDLSDETEKT